MLVFVVPSVLVTVVVIGVAANIANISPSTGLVVLSEAVFAAAATPTGETGFTTPEGG